MGDQETPTVLCTECKHSFRTWIDILTGSSIRYSLKCRKDYVDDITEIDPVIGPKTIKGGYSSCGLARVKRESCGVEGRFWEPKDTKKHFFTIIQHEQTINDR